MAGVDGGQLAARFLAEAGVRHVFTLSGGPLNPLYNACPGAGVQLIHARHDGAAAFMAEGYARASRGPGVCAVTLGTAVAMAAPAVLTAHLAATPLIVLAGAAALPSWDRRPFAQADQLALMKPITKWARTCHATTRIPEYLATALREATTGRPGPVFLEIPSDVMAGAVDETARSSDRSGQGERGRRPGGAGELPWPPRWSEARPRGDPARVREALAMIARARRPIAVAGSGVWWSDAAAELRQLVERQGLPLFSERLGRGALPADHRLNLGLSAVALSDAALRALQRCDLLLMLGARFDYLIEYGDLLDPSAVVVQVDLEPEEIGRVHEVDLGIVGDLRAVLGQMLEESGAQRASEPGTGSPGPRESWVEELRERRDRSEDALRPLLESDEVPIHPLRLIGEIRRRLDRDTIVVTSGGDIEQWGRWLLEPSFPGGSMRAGQTGSLGVDVPYSIAARLARPDKKVILLTGDGGFAYHLTEFDTAARYGLPFVAVVADDAVWAQIKHELDLVYGPGRDAPVRMVHRRWDRVVEALGGHGEHVEHPDEIGGAIERALASGKPACVHAVTRPVVSPETLWGFSAEERARRRREA